MDLIETMKDTQGIKGQDAALKTKEKLWKREMELMLRVPNFQIFFKIKEKTSRVK